MNEEGLIQRLAVRLWAVLNTSHGDPSRVQHQNDWSADEQGEYEEEARRNLQALRDEGYDIFRASHCRCGHSNADHSDGGVWTNTCRYCACDMFRTPAGRLADDYWAKRVDAMLASSDVPNPISAAFVLGREYQYTDDIIQATRICVQVERLEERFFGGAGSLPSGKVPPDGETE